MNAHATRLAMAAWFVMGVLFPVVSTAGTVTFTGSAIDLQGTGFGNSLTSLILHDNGSEHGSVLWNGAADVIADDATKQSATRTATELAAAGINAGNFSLVFNIAEAQGQGIDVTLFDFSLRFQDATGAPLFADVNYTAPPDGLTLDQEAGGVGGAGWLFTISLAPAEAAAFFGTGSNRVGMLIAEPNEIEDSSGGPDGFFFAPVPEPSSACLMALGAVAVGLIAAGRRSRQR